MAGDASGCYGLRRLMAAALHQVPARCVWEIFRDVFESADATAIREDFEACFCDAKISLGYGPMEQCLNTILGKAGSTWAHWEELFVIHWVYREQHVRRLLLHIVVRHGGSWQDAEDALQKTCAGMHKIVRHFDPSIGCFWAYLQRSIINACARLVKGSAHYIEASGSHIPAPGFCEVLDAQIDIDTLLQKARLQDRRLLTMTLEGMTDQEIADTLGTSPNAVKTQRCRAIKRIRDSGISSEKEGQKP